MKLAVDLNEAADLVPFSAVYLRQAIRRTTGNPLPARIAGRKYVIRVSDLEAWLDKEGVQV